MKLADYVIRVLAARGIDRIFVVYGAANGDLIDAFTREKATRYVAVMHEQAGGFAAEGYAKVTGKPGVAIATSGPGGMNLLTPMGNCFYDSVPCLFITGQVNSRFLRPDPSLRQVGFQEADIVAMARPVTKYARMVTDPADIRYQLEKALFLCQDQRPGPVLLDLPIDVQKAEIDPDTLLGFNAQAARPSYDLDLIDRQIEGLIADLRVAKRPVILVGGGVRSAGAGDELRDLGRELRIPCFPTWNALDLISSDYEFYAGRIGTYGGAGRNFGIQNADLLIAVGSRISGRITGGNMQSFARSAKKYVVDVDRALLQPRLQQVPFEVNLHCDAGVFARRFLSRLRDEQSGGGLPDFQAWTDRVMDWKQRYDPVRKEFFEAGAYVVDGREYVHPYAFMRLLSDIMGPNDVFVADCGGNIVVASHAFETKYGQRFITNNGNSPMGFSFAGAIGACFGDPSRRVVCIIGDGGFNMNIQELQTALNYDLNLKTFILNNHIYGITKAYQETNFQGRAEACGPVGYSPPDFLKLVDAYGIQTASISSNEDMEAGIRGVLGAEGPVVCDVNSHEFHTYEPRIFGWATPIEDMYPYLPREEFKDNMSIDPIGDWMNPVYPDVVRRDSGGSP